MVCGGVCGVWGEGMGEDNSCCVGGYYWCETERIFPCKG